MFKKNKVNMYLVSYEKKNGLIRDEQVLAHNKQQAQTISQFLFNSETDNRIISVDFLDTTEKSFDPYIMSYIKLDDTRDIAIIYGDEFTETLIEIEQALQDNIKTIVSFRRL